MQSLTRRALSKHTNNDTGAHTYTYTDTDRHKHSHTPVCERLFLF